MVAEPPDTVRHVTSGSLSSAWAQRRKPSTTSSIAEDLEEDRAWGRLRKAVDAAIGVRNPARDAAARRMKEVLFRDGLKFLSKPNHEQWAYTNSPLELIESENLTPLITLATGGSDHLDDLLAAHEEYGAALKITQAGEAEDAVNLLDELRLVRSAIGDYAFQVVAWSSHAAPNAKVARNALLPIDEARAREAERRSGRPVPEPEASPETPVPGT